MKELNISTINEINNISKHLRSKNLYLNLHVVIRLAFNIDSYFLNQEHLKTNWLFKNTALILKLKCSRKKHYKVSQRSKIKTNQTVNDLFHDLLK